MNDFRILGLAGSLRRASLHRGLVRAARELAPEGVVIEPYERLGDLPFFNQDVEEGGDPGPVRDLNDPDLDFINSMAKKYLGMDRYPYHQSGDKRVVVFVRPEHTTQMGA